MLYICYSTLAMNLRNIAALFLLAMSLFSLSAKANDSLIYNSSYEKRLIQTALKSSNPDIVGLFSSLTSDSVTTLNYKKKIERFYTRMDASLANLNAPRQKAKLIFKEVHAYFFKQYEENVMFSRIFEAGMFNCVTASMLYAIILDHYQIPYEIKEKPTHIYLVALPGRDNILFETTNPRGLYAPDEKFKREYVNNLVKLKFTTQEHVNAVGLANAFNQYYYSNDHITLEQLAGVQYYNQALSFVSDLKDEHAAIRSAVKMGMLYPCAKHTVFKRYVIGLVLDNSRYDQLRDIFYLCEYANGISDVKDEKFVLGTFESIVENKLIKEGEDTLIHNAYAILKANLINEKLLKEVTYIYYGNLGSWEYNRGNMDESLSYCEKAYAINPKDSRLQEIISRALILKSDRLRGKEASITMLHDYAEKFPFLKTNKLYKAMMTMHYAFRAYSLFLEDSGIEGYKYLSMMEENRAVAGEEMVATQDLLGLAYAEAGAYHFRKKEFNKAREIILKGLTLYPDHGELKERLKIVEDEVK